MTLVGLDCDVILIYAIKFDEVFISKIFFGFFFQLIVMMARGRVSPMTAHLVGKTLSLTPRQVIGRV